MHNIHIRLWCHKSFLRFYLLFAFLYYKISKFTLSHKRKILVIEKLLNNVANLENVFLKIHMSSMFCTIHIAIKEQREIHFRKNIIIPWCFKHDAFYCVPAQFLIRMVEFNSKTKKFANFGFMIYHFLSYATILPITLIFFNFKDFIQEYTIMLHNNLP